MFAILAVICRKRLGKLVLMKEDQSKAWGDAAKEVTISHVDSSNPWKRCCRRLTQKINHLWRQHSVLVSTTPWQNNKCIVLMSNISNMSVRAIALTVATVNGKFLMASLGVWQFKGPCWSNQPSLLLYMSNFMCKSPCCLVTVCQSQLCILCLSI